VFFEFIPIAILGSILGKTSKYFEWLGSARPWSSSLTLEKYSGKWSFPHTIIKK
jgi:hypothetical protein